MCFTQISKDLGKIYSSWVFVSPVVGHKNTSVRKGAWGWGNPQISPRFSWRIPFQTTCEQLTVYTEKTSWVPGNSTVGKDLKFSFHVTVYFFGVSVETLNLYNICIRDDLVKIFTHGKTDSDSWTQHMQKNNSKTHDSWTLNRTSVT